MDTSDLLPRPDVRALFVEALRAGSILLYGPRRIGKSTFLNVLVAEPPPDHIAVRIDLEGLLADPLVGLANQLHDRLVGAGLALEPGIIDRVEEVEAAGVGVSLRAAPDAAPWDRVQHDLAVASQTRPHRLLIVALDEVPWWLDAIVDQQGEGAARAALASLRRLRQAPVLSERVRFVLTGSIGLAGLASRLGASAELNDLATILMPPMTPEQGATLFESELTAMGRPCGPRAAAAAATLAGGSPHWIKRLAAATRSTGAPDASAVDAAADALLLPALRKQFADEGREHFRRRHPQVTGALWAMLEAVCGDDAGIPRQAALNAALAVQPELSRAEVRECLYLLVDGFYLREGPSDTLEWVNPLFRRWWQRYGGA